MTVSIIIPALNEANCIAENLRALRRQGPCEIIVVDGGSGDDTVKQARAADLMVTSPPGRAVQMNLGADQATGEYLLFLHADCTLAGGALRALERAMQRGRIVGGCFSMRVQAEGWAYRSIAAAAAARVRCAGAVYGDQGLFLRRADFIRLGAFPQLTLMEDVFFSRRLSRLGRVVVLPEEIHVAPRRWQKVGIARQSLRNWSLTALALAGVSPDRLARFYPHVR